MNKEEIRIVPQLRFPEFKQDGDWQETTLDDVADYENGKAHEQEISDTGKYKVVNSKFISTDGEVVKFTNSANLMANTGDILMVLSDIPNGRAIAKCFYVDEDDTYTVNQRICKITPTDIDNRFLFYIQNRNKYFLAFDDGVKQTNLRKDTVLSFPFLKPKALKEQQKIAACLSSLDEVITAETEKLDLLQDHKKGLLQQLFPSEGKTQPKFRFPEFKEDGDWEIDNFSSYIKLYRGSSPRPISQFTTKDENGVNWIKIGDTKNAKGFKISAVEEKITSLGAKKSRKVKRGELILANSMSYGATYELDLEGCIYDGWFVLREFEESFDKNFLLQLLNSDYLQSQYKRLAAGGIVQNISSEIVYATLLPKPSLKEQQKIAQCLSAADALIEAQAQKVEALQEHKKGLLQQLFPNLNELAV